MLGIKPQSQSYSSRTERSGISHGRQDTRMFGVQRGFELNPFRTNQRPFLRPNWGGPTFASLRVPSRLKIRRFGLGPQMTVPQVWHSPECGLNATAYQSGPASIHVSRNLRRHSGFISAHALGSGNQRLRRRATQRYAASRSPRGRISPTPLQPHQGSRRKT